METPVIALAVSTMSFNEEEFMNRIRNEFNNSLNRYPAPSIKQFSGEGTDQAGIWLEKFETQADSLKLDENTKLIKFPTYLTGFAASWYVVKIKSKKGSEGEIKTYKDLRECFLNEFENDDRLFNQILTRKQRADEGTHCYVMKMAELCKTYKGNITDDEVIRYIKAGLLPHIRQAMIPTKPKDFEEFLAMAKQVEMNMEGSILQQSQPAVHSSDGTT